MRGPRVSPMLPPAPCREMDSPLRFTKRRAKAPMAEGCQKVTAMLDITAAKTITPRLGAAPSTK